MTAPDLTTLAHAAAACISALAAEQDHAARGVGSGKPWSSDGHSFAIYRADKALSALRRGFALRDGAIPPELAGIAERVAHGIVRETWALRVVALAAQATGEQGRTAANGR